MINIGDRDKIMSDRNLFNQTVYTPLSEALKLLEDQKSNQEKDPWGDPLILTEGLCSLVNAYLENSEEEEEDD